MSENTKIEWCDHTWSPWRGCTKVSAGCANCYAEKLSHRNPAVLGQWGKGNPRVLAKNWNDPLKWNASVEHHEKMMQPVWDTAVRDRPFSERLGSWPVKRPRVFPSLCDWLDDEVPIEWLARFLKLIHDTPNLDWLLLTKRPELWSERMRKVIAGHGDRSMAIGWFNGTPPLNVWIGTSVEDQIRADERIPELLKIPARRRFLSAEPLLGPVEIFRFARNTVGNVVTALPPGGPAVAWERTGAYSHSMRTVDWVIVGGESGPGARPCNVQWIRDIVRQCAAARVPCFVKQLGARPVEYSDVAGANCAFSNHGRPITHPKGGDPAEWPEDIRVRQFPEVMR